MQRTPEEEVIYNKAPRHARYYLDEPPPSFWEVLTFHAGGALLVMGIACILTGLLASALPLETRVCQSTAGLAFVAWFLEAWRQSRQAWREERKRRYLFVARLQEATTPPDKETPCNEAESSQDL